jgi:sulfur carrier protein
VRLTVNGDARDVPDGTTVETLLLDAAGTTRGSAVVVDGEVVPRSTWAQLPLREGQAVELITAVQGG